MSRLRIRLLGPLRVTRDDAPVELPRSKKTRALLAYLAGTGRTHRRAALCALLWDGVDDPRGGLRWSLSKLRPIVDDDGGAPRLVADGDDLGLDLAGADVDLEQVTRIAARLDTATTDELEGAVGAFDGELLEDLDLPDAPAFHAWCVARRGEARALRGRLLDALIARLAGAPAHALPHARRRVELDRADERGHVTLLELLGACGLVDEAEQHYLTHRRWLDGRGERPSPSLERARHAATRPPAAGAAPTAPAPPTADAADQQIRFCTTADRVRIAYATLGAGPPLVKTANWLNHLEYDWHSPLWRHWLRELSRDRRLVRYDERGNGLSDWEVADLSLDALVADLEAVVDAAGLDRYPVLAISQGCPVAIAHAVRRPERVTHLVLLAGFATGWHAWSPRVVENARAMVALMRNGWGQSQPAFRQMFTSLYFPEASLADMHAFNELQRRTTSPDNAARLLDAIGALDVAPLLPQVKVPTLVLHARHDALIPFRAGRALAAGIPGARFVPLDSRNHLLTEGEPAFARFLDELRRFLAA